MLGGTTDPGLNTDLPLFRATSRLVSSVTLLTRPLPNLLQPIAAKFHCRSAISADAALCRPCGWTAGWGTDLFRAPSQPEDTARLTSTHIHNHCHNRNPQQLLFSQQATCTDYGHRHRTAENAELEQVCLVPATSAKTQLSSAFTTDISLTFCWLFPVVSKIYQKNLSLTLHVINYTTAYSITKHLPNIYQPCQETHAVHGNQRGRSSLDTYLTSQI